MHKKSKHTNTQTDKETQRQRAKETKLSAIKETSFSMYMRQMNPLDSNGLNTRTISARPSGVTSRFYKGLEDKVTVFVLLSQDEILCGTVARKWIVTTAGDRRHRIIRYGSDMERGKIVGPQCMPIDNPSEE